MENLRELKSVLLSNCHKCPVFKKYVRQLIFWQVSKKWLCSDYYMQVQFNNLIVYAESFKLIIFVLFLLWKIGNYKSELTDI